MPYKSLSANPSLAHLKNQARDLLKSVRNGEPQALQRVHEFHPRRTGPQEFALSDAQLTIAREYCYPSWPKLKAAVEAGGDPDRSLPKHERIADPVFRRAVDLLDAGDAGGLRRHLTDHPSVLRQRVFFDIGSYFGQPALLEFVAENPIRHGSLPSNIVEIARIILDAGSDRESINRTLEWVASGRVVREQGAQIPLIDLLCDHGADPNTAMRAALVHGEFSAAEALIRRGAELDLPAAAALGQPHEAAALLPQAGEDERHWALALASQFGRAEVVRLLLEAGVDPNRFNPVGCHSHSTPLHQAALGGHLETARVLVEFGAKLDTKDILFGGTPLGWARHSGQTAVAEYLQTYSDRGDR